MKPFYPPRTPRSTGSFSRIVVAVAQHHLALACVGEADFKLPSLPFVLLAKQYKHLPPAEVMMANPRWALSQIFAILHPEKTEEDIDSFLAKVKESIPTLPG